MTTFELVTTGLRGDDRQEKQVLHFVQDDKEEEVSSRQTGAVTREPGHEYPSDMGFQVRYCRS